MTAARATHFRLLPSRRMALLIVLAHSGAAVALLVVAHGSALAWALALLLVALGAVTAWDRALLRAQDSIRGFAPEGAETLLLDLHGGGQLHSQVGPRRWVGVHFVALPLALPRRRALIVSADMLAPEAFRHLRLWALWGRLPGVASIPREAT